MQKNEQLKQKLKIEGTKLNKNKYIQKIDKRVYYYTALSLGITIIVVNTLWLIILHFGHGGIGICNNISNPICNINIPYTKQARSIVNEYETLSEKYISQKDYRDQITLLWEDQAVLNDKIVRDIADYQRAVQNYKRYVENYTRILNGQVELLNGIDYRQFENRRAELEQEAVDMRISIQENFDRKQQIKEQIDQIYVNLNEVQPNRFREEN